MFHPELPQKTAQSRWIFRHPWRGTAPAMAVLLFAFTTASAATATPRTPPGQLYLITYYLATAQHPDDRWLQQGPLLTAGSPSALRRRWLRRARQSTAATTNNC